VTGINPKDYYPAIKPYEGVIGNYPGAVLVESRMLSVVRWATCLALLAAPARFFIQYRRTLSPSRRETILLRNFAVDHMAYGGAAGFFGGLGVGVVDTALRYDNVDDVVAKAIALRSDKEHDRWARTWAKCFICGVTYGVVFVERNPSLLYRFGVGVGGATVASLCLSYSYFDLAISHAA
jgi:hypothetical protein